MASIPAARLSRQIAPELKGASRLLLLRRWRAMGPGHRRHLCPRYQAQLDQLLRETVP
jgi:hypothetical protein